MRLVAVFFSALLLSACFTAGKRGGDAAIAIYDFGPEKARAAQALGSANIALEVKAPLWFDGMGIDYRLAYAEPNRLREYARSRWAGPPAQMMQQRLSQRLALQGVGQGRTVCVLRIEITEFSQLFDTPTNSVAVLSGKALLMDRARRTLAELPIALNRAADTPDAKGGVAALVENVEQLATQLAEWPTLQKYGATGCAG